MLFAAKVVELQGLRGMAEALGISEPMVSLIRSGKRKPSFKIATIIFSKWQIPIEAWYSERSRSRSKAKAAV